MSLTGAGQVSLTDNAGNGILGTGGAQTLTNVDNTIAGAGFIGGGNLILVNQAKGVIDATGTTNALTIDMGSGTATNAGLIESTGMGRLGFQFGTLANSGQIAVSGRGALSLTNTVIDDSAGGTLDQGHALTMTNSAIVGSSLTVASGGTVTIVGADDLNTALTNKGAIDIGANASLTVHGSVANIGVINLANTASFAELLVGTGGVSLIKAGQINLTDNAGNTILGTGGVQTLTNVHNTITGAGFIGGGQLVLINQAKGVIDATGSSNALVVDLSAGGASNAGLMEGVCTAGLTLQNGRPDRKRRDDPGGGGIGRASAERHSHRRRAGHRDRRRDHDRQRLDRRHRREQRQRGPDRAGRHGLATSLVFDKSTSLTGGGSIALGDNANNIVTGKGGKVVLTNVDNTISGAGLLGMGTLVLVNQAAGVINASGTLALTIDTGANTITNAGLIEATGAGGGVIQSAVKNTGMLAAAGGDLTVNGAVTGNGSATINGATLDLGSSFTENVTFTGTSGVLELAQSQTYTGKVTGFSLTGGTSLDLRDIAFVSAGEATFSGNKTSGVLTVTDGTHTAHITLIGNYTSSPRPWPGG